MTPQQLRGTPVIVGGRFAVLAQHELEQVGAQPLGDNISIGLCLIEAGLNAAAKTAAGKLASTQATMPRRR